MADIPSLIRLLLPTHVTGYTRPLPRYAANNCTTCATYPRAVATASSVTSLWEARLSGGAGSVEDSGIGSGTSRMVYRRSGGESSSIGKMVESVVRRVVRVGVKLARRDRRRSLHQKNVGGNSDSQSTQRHTFRWRPLPLVPPRHKLQHRPVLSQA